MDICLSISEVNWEVTTQAVSMLGTVGLVLIGMFGLREWRRQLKSTSDHELAKKLILETYRWRQAIQNVRNPMLYLNKDEVAAGRQLQEKQRIYGERLDGLFAKWAEIEALKFEADIVWGKDESAPLETLRDLTKTIKSELWMHFWLQGAYAGPGVQVDRSIDKIKANDEIVYYTSDDDSFSQKINDAVEKVELAFKKRMI